MSNSYSTTRHRSGFFTKLVFTLLFVGGIAGLMALFDVYQKNLSSFWMMVFAILSIGVAAGSIVRMTFYQWSGFVRFFMTLLAVPLGLFVLGIFTNWRMGIGPLNPWAKGHIPQDELIQLGGTLLVAIICLEAWWKPVSRVEDVAEVRRSSSRSWENAPVAVSAQSVQPRRQTRTQENLTFVSKGKSRLKFLKANKARGRTIPADRLVLTHTAQPIRSRRNRLFSRKPNLQISLYEEHRCPYCLEEVKRNDPRGVKKCEVCNTLHHADCWAITGFCQVPHLNT
jgi:hypothetical protein